MSEHCLRNKRRISYRYSLTFDMVDIITKEIDLYNDNSTMLVHEAVCLRFGHPDGWIRLGEVAKKLKEPVVFCRRIIALDSTLKLYACYKIPPPTIDMLFASLRSIKHRLQAHSLLSIAEKTSIHVFEAKAMLDAANIKPVLKDYNGFSWYEESAIEMLQKQKEKNNLGWY